MEEKIGVFICTGYGIAEAINIDALCEVATGENKVPFCKTIESCEKSALESIYLDIKNENLTKVVIAGISPRRYEDCEFPKDVIIEKFALREHVIRCLPANDEDTQMVAEDYLRMYIAKVQKMERLDPFQPEETIDKTILVLGGGVTGLTAAIEAAKTGYDVRLIEQTDKLGGWLGKQHKSVPTRPPYRELEDTGVDGLIAEIEDNSRIKVYKSATTSSISGAPGLFDVTIKSTNCKATDEILDSFRVGSMIQATGWKPRELKDVVPWGELDDVIRNVEFEDLIKDQKIMIRPSNGKAVGSVAFLQFSGSKNEEHLSFCSSICCLTSLKQALYLRERNQESKAYIFYEFIKTPGQYEDFYRRVQEDPGVFLTRGNVTDITRGEDGKLIINVKNTMPGENIQVKVDMVVLATGMVPNSADSESIRLLNDAKAVVAKGEADNLVEKAEKKVEELKQHEGTEILNLDYRQGPDVPTLQFGFPDSHFICFPYESRRTGIYMAGSVRQPMDGIASREDGTGAALKAIQCLEMISRGEAVHPRAGDISYPDFFLQRCTQCKRCTEECPFGVLNEDEKGTPLLWATRCRRCGVCMGACPERIVSFKDYSISIVSSMIKAVEIPDEDEEKPRMLALLCENDAFPAMDLVGMNKLQISPFIRIIPVRCLGSVNASWVKDAISAGFDGVILIGCKYGDDYQCHYINGSELAAKRGENISDMLEQMAMENERVELHQLQISEYDKLPVIFANFADLIEEIGMNPFKGM
ncbi:MAG: hydrogenase iron-sulfur subunit [Calditrichaeota bacterium]|nr:hydrogenase iron-sulfur subunit [Calditrichota bacterium]MBT7790592.1 hydrogenase iron-sulfur subunit [Calditrichota bacterium]